MGQDSRAEEQRTNSGPQESCGPGPSLAKAGVSVSAVSSCLFTGCQESSSSKVTDQTIKAAFARQSGFLGFHPDDECMITSCIHIGQPTCDEAVILTPEQKKQETLSKEKKKTTRG